MAGCLRWAAAQLEPRGRGGGRAAGRDRGVLRRGRVRPRRGRGRGRRGGRGREGEGHEGVGPGGEGVEPGVGRGRERGQVSIRGGRGASRTSGREPGARCLFPAALRLAQRSCALRAAQPRDLPVSRPRLPPATLQVRTGHLFCGPGASTAGHLWPGPGGWASVSQGSAQGDLWKAAPPPRTLSQSEGRTSGRQFPQRPQTQLNPALSLPPAPGALLSPTYAKGHCKVPAPAWQGPWKQILAKGAAPPGPGPPPHCGYVEGTACIRRNMGSPIYPTPIGAGFPLRRIGLGFLSCHSQCTA